MLENSRKKRILFGNVIILVRNFRRRLQATALSPVAQGQTKILLCYQHRQIWIVAAPICQAGWVHGLMSQTLHHWTTTYLVGCQVPTKACRHTRFASKDLWRRLNVQRLFASKLCTVAHSSCGNYPTRRPPLVGPWPTALKVVCFDSSWTQ